MELAAAKDSLLPRMVSYKLASVPVLEQRLLGKGAGKSRLELRPSTSIWSTVRSPVFVANVLSRAISAREGGRVSPKKNSPGSKQVKADGKSFAEMLGDWSKGWPGGETGLYGWVDMLELKGSTAHQFATSYNPEKLADVMKERPEDVRARAFNILVKLGGFAGSLLLDMQTGKQGTLRDKQRAKDLRRILIQLGPSFVKVGQSLSVRPDICPPEYIEEFSELQDRIPPFPTPLAYALIEEELGEPVQQVFSKLSPEPVAAASLGQVYKGQLKSTREWVAVKVQRPGIGDNIALDMFLVRKLASWIDKTRKYGSSPLSPIVDEFAGRLFGELDYIKEGQNSERFHKLYGSLPHIRVPKVHWKHTTRRVLTMEWIDGVKLTDRKGLQAYGLKTVDFVDLGVDCTMHQLLGHGYFHADPHPGNILATKEGDLVYLDFGMMSEAPQSARYGLMEHIVHLVNREYEAMAKDYYKLGFLDPNVDVSPLVPELAQFFDNVLSKTVSELNFKAIIDGLGDVLFKFPFQVPPYYALIARTLTILEGIAMKADPSYRLIAKAYPYVAKRLLTDDANELRSSLQDFLVKDGTFRWRRLEDLVQQGDKQGGIEEEQFWTLLRWTVSEQKANGLRNALVNDFVRFIDVLGVNATRAAASSLGGSVSASKQEIEKLLDRAFPMERADRQTLEQLLLLRDSVIRPAGQSDSESQTTQSWKAPWDAAADIISSFSTTVSNVRLQVDKIVPEIQQLAGSPGFSQMAADIGQGLLTRMGARAVRLLLREETDEDSKNKDDSRP